MSEVRMSKLDEIEHQVECGYEVPIADQRHLVRRCRDLERFANKVAARTCACGGSDPDWHSDRCLKAEAERVLKEGE